MTVRQRLLLASLLGLATKNIVAGNCTADVSHMDRGEFRPVLLCGQGIPVDYRIEGLAEAGISVEYQQYLDRCSPELNEPGIYLWLRAGARATSASLSLRDASGGTPACEVMPVAVPDRTLLPDASLRLVSRDGSNIHLLEISAPSGVSFSQACESGLVFPADRQWPDLALLTQDELTGSRLRRRMPTTPMACTTDRISAIVSASGEQRFPAKIVIRGVSTADGRQVEGVSYATLPEPAWSTAMPASAARYIDVDGYRTRYFEAGRGEDTIVLVHGGQPDPISPTAEFWRQNVPDLATSFRVIAFDMLGCGLTDNPRTPEDYLHYYERLPLHLYGLIRALGLTRVHLVGHSQGGWPALRVALDHPEIVRSVTSVDTVLAPFAGASGNKAVGRFAYLLMHGTPPEGPTVESLMREQLLAAETWNNLSWRRTEERLEFARLPKLGEARRALQAVRMSPGHPAFRELRQQALADLEAGQLKVPHLLVWGFQDPLAPFDLGLEFLKIASHSPAPTQLVVINQSGHSPQLEHPGQFNAAVLSFVSQYRSPRSTR
ncbi:MAG: alpha/beta hydrolase [Gammaproteobacteria bacterium]|nr:alpha/beta hydrolase [Gammaproteobacteria bacterium]MDH5275743.1 alpha/beta hydrolase [Gammaproteobacteria bacterium]